VRKGLAAIAAFSLMLTTAQAIRANPAGADGAVIVSADFPDALPPGAQAQATVTVENTGTTTWTRDQGYKLGAVGDADVFHGPDPRVWLPQGASVSPGSSFTFVVALTAPASPGALPTRWRMVHEGADWFGAEADATIAVGGAPSGDDAAVVAATFPATIAAGSNATATVTVLNTGSSAWTSDVYKLGAVGDADPLHPQEPRVWLPAGTVVAPGTTYTFSFALAAPYAGGSFVERWRMVHEGADWFGAVAEGPVSVGIPAAPAPAPAPAPPPPPPAPPPPMPAPMPTLGTDGAAVDGSDLPTALAAGEGFDASVTVRNTGTTPWTSDVYKLGAVGDHDALYAGGSRVYLPAGTTVAPGAVYTFRFHLTAASVATYTTSWRMVHEGIQWFGATVTRTVNVTAQAIVVDPSTLTGKVVFGYQGWFACAGDSSPVDNWVHWSPGVTPDASDVTFDLWPDTSELDADELFATSFTNPDGSASALYSAWNAKTVARHFKWMRQSGIDGVLLQRFTVELQGQTLPLRDGVLANVRAGAEAEGRVFSVEYDISGTAETNLVATIVNDWKHLVDDLHATSSPRYLQHRGKPLVTIWGFGFPNHPGTPADVQAVMDFFRNDPNPAYHATVSIGVPAGWRTLSSTKTDPGWPAAFRSADVINPWMVGSYTDDASDDAFTQNLIVPDLAECRSLGIDYMPVIFPGFSWTNLQKGTNVLNATPRRGGDFYWHQVHNVVAAGCTMVFNAMFDEVDEGTAMFKIAATAAERPVQGQFVTMDQDGVALASDWYLRLGGAATAIVHGTAPDSASIPIQGP
jgi:hypothetical protein